MEELTEPCPHETLEAKVQIVKFGPDAGLAITRVVCKCGKEIKFKGLPVGMSPEMSTRSEDGRFAHLALDFT